jgi:hypothetical protein
MLASALLAVAVSVAPAPAAASTPSPQRTLALIRNRFRSHRPPPAYETYTLVRKQLASNGYPDYAESYTKHFWVRNVDRAALSRLVFRDDARGPLAFDRPAFNEARDPGPPTADVFEPAPIRPHPVEFVPTPEPNYTAPPLIGTTAVVADFDYTVTSVSVEGDELHLHVEPRRDPDRNRIREIWADKSTYELRKLVATDKLFITGGRTERVYPATDTITIGFLQGVPVVTAVHADVGGGYNDDGKQIDITFSDITFPSSLPSWYFDPHTYAQHQNDAPS